MKKIIVGLSLILLILVSVMGTVYAADPSVSLKTSKNEYAKKEEFTIDVVLSGLTTQKGVAALMATLEYDKDSLTLVKTETQNGWSAPNYNESNGKLITDKNSNVTGTETVLKITFKVNENAKQNLVVTLKNITVSGGDGDIEIARAYKEFTVQNGTTNPKPNPGEDDQKPGKPDDNNTVNNTIDNTVNNNTNNNNQKPNTNNEGKLNVVSNQVDGNASGRLPQTGSYNTVFIVGGVVAIIGAAVFFVRMRILKLK